MRPGKHSLTVAIILSFAGSLPAEETVFSGPQAGETLPPLKVELVGEKPHGSGITDIAVASAERPALLVFVCGSNRPAARLTRVLMNYAEMRAADGLYAATVWLDTDISAARIYLREAVSWWGFGPHLGISIDGAEGPGSYGLNRNVNVTVLICNRNRVVANHPLIQPSETDAAPVLAEVCTLIGGTAPNRSQVVFLSLPTHKNESARWHTAPRDLRLRGLIHDLLGANDATSAALAAQSLENHLVDRPQDRLALAHVADMLSKGRTKLDPIAATPFLKRWRRVPHGDR